MLANKFRVWMCMVAMSLMFSVSAIAAQQSDAPTGRLEQLEMRLDFLDKRVAERLDASDKLVQSKVDQVSAIAQNMESGRIDVDWWLQAIALALALIGVMAVVVPFVLQRKQVQVLEAELRGIRDTFDRLKQFEHDAKEDMRRGLDDLREAAREAREHSRHAQEEADKAAAAREEAEKLARTPVQDKGATELRQMADTLKETKGSEIAKLSAKALEFAESGQWDEAISRWRALADIDPDAEGHWFNQGYAYQELADVSDDRVPFLRRSSEAYAEAVRIKPDMYEAWNNWGIALIGWARALPEPERPDKFAEACGKYVEAVRIKPDMHEAWYNWGNALADWALALPEPERPDKFAEAGGVFAEAVHIKPDKHEAWNNWGSALIGWARALPEPERPDKFAEAGGKFAEAVRIKPDMHEAWNNWGNALIGWARALPEPERPDKFAEAMEKLMRAEAIIPGSGAYNLACAAALSGHADEARSWLAKARESGVAAAMDCAPLKQDHDLDSLRGLDWFEDWLAKVCGDSEGETG